MNTQCSCGHVQAAHEHFRRGTDCGVCGARTCRAYRGVAVSSLPAAAPVVEPVVEPVFAPVVEPAAAPVAS